MKKYKKIKELGRGAFGFVCLYENIESGRLSAIKEISVKGAKEEEIEKLENEAEILKRNKSPYVVKCYESFVEDSSLYIVLEYCSQGNLNDLLEKACSKEVPLKEELIWTIFLKLCLGLSSFHIDNIVHRDLKPENIFMFSQTLPKIGDVGLSKNLSANSLSHGFVGTLNYLSPEVLNNEPYTEKSDVWALGCILYQLCTFKLPFSELIQIITQPPQDIPECYSQDLRNLVFQILQKSPEKRPNISQLFSQENIKKKLINLGLYNEAIQIYKSLNTTPVKNALPILEVSQFIEDAHPVQNRKPIVSFCFLKDGRIASCNYESISVYSTNKAIFPSDIFHNFPSNSVTGLKDGKLLSASGTKRYGCFCIWEVTQSNMNLVQKAMGHSLPIWRVIELEDGRLCSCSFDEEIKIWERQNDCKCIQTLFGHNNPVMLLIEVNNYIVSSDCGGKALKIWNKSTYECVETINDVGYCCWSNSVSKVEDNKIIFGGTKQITTFDVLNLSTKFFIDEEFEDIRVVCTLKNGKVLLGNDMGGLFCFDPSLNQIIFKQNLHSSIFCLLEIKDNEVLLPSLKVLKIKFVQL